MEIKLTKTELLRHHARMAAIETAPAALFTMPYYDATMVLEACVDAILALHYKGEINITIENV